MSQSYENLPGASGRAQFFRPTRHKAAAVFGGYAPQIWFEDSELALENISANGAAASTMLINDEAADEASGLGLLRLTQSGREIFRGRARKARVKIEKGAHILGLALEGEFFNLDYLAKENAKALILNGSHLKSAAQVPAQYKEFCADVHSFAGGYLERLSRGVGPLEKKFSRTEKEEIFGKLYDEIKKPWGDMLVQGNDLVIPHHDDREMRKALKLYTERVITRSFLKGPTWKRSYEKPLGYPGDYALMNYMYDEKPEGDTLEEMFLHSLGLVAGRPIVARMYTLGDILLAESAKRGADTMRVTSIGSGPAREFDHMYERAAPESSWEVTFIDQEARALEYAITSHEDAAHDKRFNLTALNASFTEMLSPAQSMISLPPQDIIYSLGLVDYLSLPLAMKFAKRMYRALKPGGKLIIANVNNLSTGITWQAEHITDWTLYFRSKEEMLAMAQGVPEAKIEIAEDGIRSVYFLIATKPEA